MSKFKTLLRSFAAISVFAAATSAHANETWFFGLGVGQSNNSDYECTGCGAPIGSLDDSDEAYKVFGGFKVNEGMALLAGYTDLGQTTATGAGAAWTDRLEVDGFYFASQAILPINESFEVFALAGLFRWDQTVTFNGASGTFQGTDPIFGLGASYLIPNTGLKAQVEWNRFFDVGTNDPTFGHIDDYDLYTINLVLEF